MALVLGFNCKLYRNTGTYASPTWNLVDNVQDFEIGLSKEVAEATIRGSNGWVLKKGTLKDGEMSWGMIYDTQDADFTAFLDSFLDNTTIDLLALDGPVATAGSQGFRAIVDTLNFKKLQKLKEFAAVEITVAPTYNNSGASGAFVAPDWVTMPLS